ncbi:receptor-type tyrosine-protein phosphatase gamma-like [Thalassophryne amazonica]|uniref:receptor-type tyrosine-protein phosphatase gamma-like n=1 Tax=Thalassophryne amazonica TaxID=390379 RepID=UPI001471A8D9|nr:receptor-type tyrosine-protein phosphatase gamma-like [Thalassophryne amazonica]
MHQLDVVWKANCSLAEVLGLCLVGILFAGAFRSEWYSSCRTPLWSVWSLGPSSCSAGIRTHLPVPVLVSPTGLTGNQAESPAPIQGHHRAATSWTRLRRAAAEETYWSYSVAIMLKDEFFVRGAGLPGRFKAEKVEFHWGPSNGSEGSEHSINGRRYPVEMQIYMYNSDDFDSLSAALREKRIIAAMAVFFQVGATDNPAVDPIIHGLRGVVHHEKETFLEPFVLKDLLPASLGSYYRYTGSLTTPPCSKVVEWIVFSRPIYVSYKQLEAFYSIFTTEQQDHVKSVEYLRSNFRPIQSLGSRHVFKSAIKDAWMPHMIDGSISPYGTEASKVCSSAPTNMKVQHVNASTLMVRWTRPEVTYHPPILHFLVSYSWTAHDDSYEETHVTDAKQKPEAIISPVSPDVLYLFRVQAVCMNDMRSDFSQSMLFRANTTRIFEGTRIVKTGMPTISPASSADMAPISSGSSTWTSSGLPFSFVSMATGIGPSSSGSQATVASVVTSTLLVGLGFSGGVISSFPSSIWPTRMSTHDPASTHQSANPVGPTRDTTSIINSPKDSGEAGSTDTNKGKDQGEDGEKEAQDKEEEEEDEKEEKKKRKGSRGLCETGRQDNIRPVKEHKPTAKQEEAAEAGVTPAVTPVQEELLDDLPDSSPVSGTSAVLLALKEPAASLCSSHGPFSILTDNQSRVKWRLLAVRDSKYTDYINYVDKKSEQYLLTQNIAGNTVVTMKSTQVHACCTVYHFTLWNSKVLKDLKWNPKGQAQNDRSIPRYHYSLWPNMGFPESTLPVVTSVHRSSATHILSIGAVSVHFSSGQGLMAMSIVCNYTLQQDKDKSTADGPVFLEDMRSRHSVTLTHSAPQRLDGLEWRGNPLSDSVNQYQYKVLLCLFGTKVNVFAFLDIPGATSEPAHRLMGLRPWKSSERSRFTLSTITQLL